jgi:hypothetical protein
VSAPPACRRRVHPVVVWRQRFAVRDRLSGRTLTGGDVPTTETTRPGAATLTCMPLSGSRPTYLDPRAAAQPPGGRWRAMRGLAVGTPLVTR